MASAPRAWLTKRGFNPDGDLCTAIESKRDPEVETTAMCEAVYAGELLVYQWLFKREAASIIRTKDSEGSNPMLSTCYGGHLDVAQWLFEVGAAEDIRTENNDGKTPVLWVCFKEHPDVAK